MQAIAPSTCGKLQHACQKLQVSDMVRPGLPANSDHRFIQHNNSCLHQLGSIECIGIILNV